MMRLRELHNELDSDHAEPSPPQSIDAWLDVFDRLLHLPEARRSAIRDELRGHLTERVRDLTLRGATNEQAMQQAISELGEAAELAQRIRHANRYPRRRLIMNLVLAGLGAAVITTSVAVFTTAGQSSGVNATMFQQSAQRADDADVLQSVRIDVNGDMTPRQIIKTLADTEKLGVSVDWGSLAELGIAPDEPFGLTADDVSVLTLLNVMNRRVDDTYDVLDWRLRDERRLTIDRREVFDRQERTLVSYDITMPLQLMNERYGILQSDAVEQISALIYEMVEPEQWDVMGGNLAQLQVVGGKMFVNAPPRMHDRVKWIIDELSGGGSVLDDAAAEAGRTVRAVELKQKLAEQDAALARAKQRLEEVHDLAERINFLERELDLARTVKTKIMAELETLRVENEQLRAELRRSHSARPAELQPGDVVTVRIFELMQPGEWFQVTRELDARGVFALPEIGELKVLGATESDVQQMIETALKDVLVNPQVVVVRRPA